MRSLLDDLDGQVAAAGGRVYLAEDGRLSSRAFAAMYPGLAAWRAVRHGSIRPGCSAPIWGSGWACGCGTRA